MWCVFVFDPDIKRYVPIKYAFDLPRDKAIYARKVYAYVYPERSFIFIPRFF